MSDECDVCGVSADHVCEVCGVYYGRPFEYRCSGYCGGCAQNAVVKLTEQLAAEKAAREAAERRITDLTANLAASQKWLDAFIQADARGLEDLKRVEARAERLASLLERVHAVVYDRAVGNAGFGVWQEAYDMASNVLAIVEERGAAPAIGTTVPLESEPLRFKAAPGSFDLEDE